MKSFYIGLFIIFLGGLISLNFSERFKAKIQSTCTGIGMIFVLIPSLQVLFTNHIISRNIYFPDPVGIVDFVIDPLSAFFVLVISVMSFIGTLYAIGYIKPYLNQNRVISSHFLFVSVLITSMLLVVTVQNALFFLIVWEIMSLSSFFLVIFENEKKEVISAGINYLVTMHISILFIILSFILLTLKSGNFDFNSFKEVFSSNIPLANSVFILLFTGFGIKAGFVPLHTWLPKAHPAAPCHVSGIMSGVMIKTGIYGILRMLLLIRVPSLEISYMVLIISVITALFGVLYATAQHDLKKLLAYSSIENIGIIGIGIGLGMLGLAYHNNLVALVGFSGGILHVLNHSIFKELLFFGAGAVYSKTHTKNIEILGGLIKAMPFTAILFMIGSIAIIGLPPFNGFISEFLIYFGLLHNFEVNSPVALIISAIAIAAVALVGTLALLCFTKAFSIIFQGNPRSEKAAQVKDEASSIMILSMAILAIFILLIGLLPQYALKIVQAPTLLMLHNQEISYDTAVQVNIFKTISLVGISFVVMFAVIFCLRQLLLKNKNVTIFKTWDCGYQSGNNRIQYTASSYASLLLSFLRPFFIKEFNIKKPRDLFPKDARFELHIHDIVEFYMINPILSGNRKFLERFYWIQSGSTQQYILYGLIFLIAALAGTIGVK